MSSLPPWASFILFNRARNNLKTNLKAAPTLAIGHPSLHKLVHLTLLRLHRELPGPTTPLPGCLSLLVLRPLAMYHDLVFTYARDLALALERPDLIFLFLVVNPFESNVFGRLPASWRALVLLRNPIALHRRHDLGRASRSPDTMPHTHIEEVDYDADENNPLPSINPPPGRETSVGPCQ